MAETTQRAVPAVAWIPPARSRLSQATAWVTTGYVAVTFAGVAATAGTDARHAVLLAVHAVLLGGLMFALRLGGATARWALAWLPLAAIPLLYAELPYLIAFFGAPFADPLVQRWEGTIWNGQPARSLAGAMPSLLVSELLHLAYVSYYALIYAPLAALWVRAVRPSGETAGDTAARAFDEASLAVIITFVVCFAAFIVFPVQGPRFLWPAPDGIPDGPVRRLVLGILEQGSSRGAAFPSSHMAVAVAQALMALHWRMPGRFLIAAATVGIGIGAVYGGFHYAVDMLAGAALGAAVFVAVRRWGREG